MRSCGSCQLCCKLLPMAGDTAKAMNTAMHMIEAGLAKIDDFKGMVPEIKKEAGERCLHQRHGKGCAIYAKRPFSCRMWSCRWLLERDTTDLKRPDHSHYVIDLVPDYVTSVDNLTGERRTIPVVQVWVDPRYPDAHRDPNLRAYLERRGLDGYAALIRYNERDGFTLFPPALAQDGQWHEIEGEMEPPHKPLPMTAVFGD